MCIVSLFVAWFSVVVLSDRPYLFCVAIKDTKYNMDEQRLFEKSKDEIRNIFVSFQVVFLKDQSHWN